MHDEAGSDFRQLEIAPTLSAIERLQHDRGYRDSRGLFFIEGVRNFIEAVDHRFSVDTLLYSEKLLIQPLARKLVRRLKCAGVPFARVAPEQFRGVSRTERASGVGAILRQRVLRLDQINLADQACWTAISNVRSSGNVGMLIRTSAATGAAGFILLGDSIDPFDPAVVRATMGALFKQALVRTNIDQLRRWVLEHKVEVIGASPDGTEDYREVSYTRPALLVLGSERKGLTDEQRGLCNRIVRISMVEGMDSLNVAVAGSLLMYEVFRPSPDQERGQEGSSKRYRGDLRF
jgi:TrmH family RNA methyltransferase